MRIFIKYQAAVPETGWLPQVFSGHLSVWGGLGWCRCTPRESAWSRCPSLLSPHAPHDSPWGHCKTWPYSNIHLVSEARSPIAMPSLITGLFFTWSTDWQQPEWPCGRGSLALEHRGSHRSALCSPSGFPSLSAAPQVGLHLASIAHLHLLVSLSRQSDWTHLWVATLDSLSSFPVSHSSFFPPVISTEVKFPLKKTSRQLPKHLKASRERKKTKPLWFTVRAVVSLWDEDLLFFSLLSSSYFLFLFCGEHACVAMLVSKHFLFECADQISPSLPNIPLFAEKKMILDFVL